MQRAINTTQIIHEFWIHSLGKSLNKLLSSTGNVNCLTFVAPRLIVVTDAEAATVIFSEESAWCRMLQSNVTEDMIIWRIERIPLRASNKCFWSTLTKSLNRGGGGGDTYHLLRLTNGYLLDLGLWSRSFQRSRIFTQSYLVILSSRVQQAVMDNGCDPF